TERDLAFRPSDEARSMLETLEHIFGLSNVIVNSTQLQPNDFSQPREKLGYAEMRKKTLENFQQASEILKTATQSDLEDFKIVFQYPDGNSREYPFWNQLNGPIADAIWHVGQVVTFRRSAGNPINGNVSVLRGTLKTN
ncbi:MAG: hypothetical protein KI790_15765, partial [Cyclobacteriaceae bacterium]|nr:hypothetical protein [Cyclobacteriaceae bacterium HetDA_MAG_MS6]